MGGRPVPNPSPLQLRAQYLPRSTEEATRRSPRFHQPTPIFESSIAVWLLSACGPCASGARRSSSPRRSCPAQSRWRCAHPLSHCRTDRAAEEVRRTLRSVRQTRMPPQFPDAEVTVLAPGPRGGHLTSSSLLHLRWNCGFRLSCEGEIHRQQRPLPDFTARLDRPAHRLHQMP